MRKLGLGSSSWAAAIRACLKASGTAISTIDGTKEAMLTFSYLSLTAYLSTHLIFCWKKQVPGADLSQSRIIPDRSLLRFPHGCDTLQNLITPKGSLMLPVCLSTRLLVARNIITGSVNFFKACTWPPPFPSFLKWICWAKKGNSKKNLSHFWFTRSGWSTKSLYHALFLFFLLVLNVLPALTLAHMLTEASQPRSPYIDVFTALRTVCRWCSIVLYLILYRSSHPSL